MHIHLFFADSEFQHAFSEEKNSVLNFDRKTRDDIKGFNLWKGYQNTMKEKKEKTV